jgi:hemolysin activation/secretion protein
VRIAHGELARLIAAGSLLASGVAAGQQPPIVPATPAPPAVVPQYTPPTPAPPPPRRFLLREVRFSPSALLEKSELEQIAASYVGRDADIRDLNRLVAEVNALYQKKGMLTARAILPPQKVENGIVNVDLVEGRLGKVELTGNRYTKDEYILSRLPLAPGAVIDGHRLERDLKWFNRTNDLALDATMKPGGAFAESDLVIKVIEPPRYSLRLFADNEGIPSTGRTEAGLSFQGNGLAGMGDSLSAYFTHSAGADNGSLSYKMPVTRKGGSLALAYAQNTTAINAGPFASLDVTAESSTLLGTYTHPWLADSQWLVTTPITLSRTRSETMISDVKLSEFDVRKASAGVSIDVRDAGYRAALLQTVGGLKSKNETLGTEVDRVVFNGTGAGLMRLGEAYYGVLRGGWQYSPQTDLPPSELFSIGGRATVRGYTRAFVAGKDGYYAGIEAHKIVSSAANLYAFYDEGVIKNSNFPHQRIRGIGAGVAWTYKNATLDVTGGRALDKIQPEQSQYVFDVRVELAF